jgi:hypothetical protein
LNWLTRCATGGVILVTAAFGGWACTDDDGNELTLEEYFQRIEDLDNDFSERGDAAFENVPDEPEVTDVRDALIAFTDILDDFVAELDDLEAPEEARDAHDRAIDSGNEVRAEYERLVDLADDAESVDDLVSETQSESFTEASDRFTTACLDLQEVANENSIDVGLSCGDE